LSWPTRIALVGFMASGKSTVGRILAERTGYGFVDSDEEIESRAQAKVSEIFRLHGEARFRELEQQTIRDLLKEEGRVIATGGGAFAQPACAEDLLARAFTIHLGCDFDEAFRRVAPLCGRPLFEKGETEARALFAERKDKYSRAHATVDTTHRSPGEVADDVLRLLPQDR
jgi:shikimate kinase